MTTDILARAETELAAKVMVEVGGLLGRRRMSQAEFARRLGVKPMWVSDRFTGRVKLTVDDMARIAQALDVDPIELLPRRGQGNVSVGSVPAPVTVSGQTPWPDHPVLTGAMAISPLTRPHGPPPSPTRTYPTGR